jgi:hypothetical protein
VSIEKQTHFLELKQEQGQNSEKVGRQPLTSRLEAQAINGPNLRQG